MNALGEKHSSAGLGTTSASMEFWHSIRSMLRKSGSSWSKSGTWQASGIALTQGARVAVGVDVDGDVSAVTDKVEVVTDDVDVVNELSGDEPSIDDPGARGTRVEDRRVDNTVVGTSSNGDSSLEDRRIEDMSVDDRGAIVPNEEKLSIDESTVDRPKVDVRELDDTADNTSTAIGGRIAHLPLGQTGTSRCMQRPTLTPVSSETVSPTSKHDAAGPAPKEPSAVWQPTKVLLLMTALSEKKVVH